MVSVPSLPQNAIVGLDNFIRLLRPSCDEIFLITGEFPYGYDGAVHVIRVRAHPIRLYVDRILGKLIEQAREAVCLIRLARRFSVVLFHYNPHHNQLPLVCAKLLGKRIVVYQFGGNYILEQRLGTFSAWEGVLKHAAATLSRMSYELADVIICEGGKNLMRWDRLGKHERKLVWFVARYVDADRFNVRKPYAARRKLVGYFGRLDPKKGILNFVRAIPVVRKQRDGLRFVIAGTGPLRQTIQDEIRVAGLSPEVHLTGFIDEGEVPNMLNEWRLLVLPTYDDGIPEVVKEAMACGTVVAVTCVGGIPDLIDDNRHAFIIWENTPQGVAEAILRALDCGETKSIVASARDLIEKQYAFDVMAVRYRNMLLKALGVC